MKFCSLKMTYRIVIEFAVFTKTCGFVKRFVLRTECLFNGKAVLTESHCSRQIFLGFCVFFITRTWRHRV